MIWLGRFFFKVQFSKELFWTDRADGGRLYHFLNIGYYNMNHIQEGCRSLSVTVLFSTIKFGWIKK